MKMLIYLKNHRVIAIIIVIIIVDIISLLIYLWILGAFSTIEIVEKQMGPYYFVYEDFTGDYKKSGKIFDQVYQQLLQDKILTKKGLGIYYDDPQKVEVSKLRSKLGSIIEDENQKKLIAELKKYKIMQIEKKKSIVVQFPYKNIWSIIIGVVKVYPQLNKYINARNYKSGPIMEIYDQENHLIYYIKNI